MSSEVGGANFYHRPTGLWFGVFFLLLALVSFLEQKNQLSLTKYLARELNTSHPTSWGLVFEPFGAYLLACAFSEPKKLSDVFEFVGDKKANKVLQGEFAQLVRLEKVGDEFRSTPFQITTNLRSSHVLGRSPSTVADTLEWLQNPQGSAFCFPANAVGPDLIFVLRLKSDQTVLRVCVQFKHHMEDLSPAETKKAIRTTDPSTFLSQMGEDKSPYCSDPGMRASIKEAINNLGTRTKKAGECGLLQVVFSHPSDPNSKILEKAAEQGHPLATVNLNFLEPEDSNLGQTILALAKDAVQGHSQKRKSSDKLEEASPRTLRSGTNRVRIYNRNIKITY